MCERATSDSSELQGTNHAIPVNPGGPFVILILPYLSSSLWRVHNQTTGPAPAAADCGDSGIDADM